MFVVSIVVSIIVRIMVCNGKAATDRAHAANSYTCYGTEPSERMTVMPRQPGSVDLVGLGEGVRVEARVRPFGYDHYQARTKLLAYY